MKKSDYKDRLTALQVELVRAQRHLIASGGRVLIVLEGRDAAGKDSTIKAMTQHMAPRETRIVALPKPSDRERGQWYFQRYAAHLPSAEEFVIFNRSWYNRAGVEPVMGFCSKEERDEFLGAVSTFEALLVAEGIQLFKYYLDIDREEQADRLAERAADPLKQWKLSPIDAAAQERWDDYTVHRNLMLARSHTAAAPWTVVRYNDKRSGRINLIRDLLARLPYPGKDESLLISDPDIVFRFAKAAVNDGRLAA